VWRSVAGSAAVVAVWALSGTAGAAAADAVASTLRLPAAYDVMLRLSGGFAASVGLVGALWLVQRVLHGRTLRSLVTWDTRVAWRRMLTGAGVWLALLALAVAAGALADPRAYRLTLEPGPLAVSLLAVVPLVALQAVGEELFFRGYLLLAMARWTRSPLVLVPASALLFALPHLANPEVVTGGWLAAVPYALMGGFLAAVALRDGRLELVIGLHLANNLAAAVLVGSPGSVLAGTAPIVTAGASSPAVTLAVLATQASLFWLVVFRLGRAPAAVAGRDATQE
jgi:membrane protease YdiL (CAAX protease family)